MTAKFQLCLFLLVFGLLAFTGAGANIQMDNTAVRLDSGKYEWKLFLDADPSVKDQIKYVEYVLHPTFPNPVRRCDRSNDFVLEATGWGEFDISATVVFENGEKQYLKHHLRLQERDLREVAPIDPEIFTRRDTRKWILEARTSRESLQRAAPNAHFKRISEARTSRESSQRGVSGFVERSLIEPRNTSRYLGDDQWEWQVFIASDEATLGQVAYVEYTLHPTFRNPVKIVSEKGETKGQGFPFTATGWGTFTIGVKVVFTDREERYLSYDLKFGHRPGFAPISGHILNNRPAEN